MANINKNVQDPPKRSVLEEIGNAVTHGIGAIFAVITLILMLAASSDSVERISAIIYSSGLFLMMTVSCLYHSFGQGSAVKRLFRRFDYSCIYLLIGATFAPILLSYVGGRYGVSYFIIQWTVIAIGVALVATFGPHRYRASHVVLYLLLGWSGLLLLPNLIAPEPAFAWYIVGGGAIYSLGIIPYAMKKRCSHFIWHFFVLAGAVVQWVGIYLYIYLI